MEACAAAEEKLDDFVSVPLTDSETPDPLAAVSGAVALAGSPATHSIVRLRRMSRGVAHSSGAH